MLCILGISFILILKQPDLGTALIIAYTGLILLWLAGLSKKFFIYGALILFIFTPLIWQYALKPYQKNRIAVFLGYGNNYKERYQIEQATIAIGSGGIWGKDHYKAHKINYVSCLKVALILFLLCCVKNGDLLAHYYCYFCIYYYSGDFFLRSLIIRPNDTIICTWCHHSHYIINHH